MKVLILIADLPLDINDIKGGVHSALINLLNGFKNKNVSVSVLAFKRKISNHFLQFSDNIQIHYINEGIFPFHSLNFFFFGSYHLKKQLQSFNPDIIHYQEGNSFLLTHLFNKINVPFLLTIHGFAIEEAKRKIKWKDKITWYFNGALNKLLIPTNIIHLSEFSKSKNNNSKIKNSAIIPNSLVEDYFDVPVKKNTSNKLLYIGIIDNNKNLFYTFNILKRLIEKNYNYTIDVLGGFSNDVIKNIILKQVENLGIQKNVNFRGWVNKLEVIHYLKNNDILVVSSKHESLPMVIAESMASSKVVVCSDVGGIPEMILDTKTGFLHQLSNPESIYQILTLLYNNNKLINEIGMNAKEYALNNFHCSIVAEKTISFYKQLTSNYE
jgi:glycosyltransferase involved in cell wall biosynthesis